MFLCERVVGLAEIGFGALKFGVLVGLRISNSVSFHFRRWAWKRGLDGRCEVLWLVV